MLCEPCAAQFYAACVGCGVLTPHDEAVARDGAPYCLACFAKPVEGEEAEALSEAELAALVAEFVRLHAEEKRITDRLKEVKEKLKRHAATEPRAANAVVLRAGEHAVKCGYTVRVSYDAEKLAAAERLLGEERFAALFEREVKYSANKDRLEIFLADDGAEHSAARAAILAAAERKETATLTLVAPKPGAGKAAKKSPAKSPDQSSAPSAE
jgi:hypothetical protein